VPESQPDLVLQKRHFGLIRNEAEIQAVSEMPEEKAVLQPYGNPFKNFDAVRNAGAAAVRKGEPGYGPKLDRDRDGIGCELWQGRRMGGIPGAIRMVFILCCHF